MALLKEMVTTVKAFEMVLIPLQKVHVQKACAFSIHAFDGKFIFLRVSSM